MGGRYLISGTQLGALMGCAKALKVWVPEEHKVRDISDTMNELLREVFENQFVCDSKNELKDDVEAAQKE